MSFIQENNSRQERMGRWEVWSRNECNQIQRAVFDVYRQMGCGLMEAVYQECLEKELLKRGIPFVARQEFKLFYKNEALLQTYVADFICYESIVVEIKALSTTTGAHKTQVLNYLEITGMRVGLLINFGSCPKATIERIVL
ncbi:GxxExxY protein [Methylobacter sp.]|uniref:GxxExxY protein n=1 Tax=Methylobacter sp. TaxID=2051955 RepID=UPI002FDD9E32